jgi:glycosyltransferase involved in cell wall biosynthesis
VRILQVNKFGTSGSGAERYFLDVSEKLVARGHHIAFLCSDPAALPQGARLFEVPGVDFHAATSLTARLQSMSRVLWSRGAADVMQGALREFRPDVVHFHNYSHQLSNSVVHAARSAGVPTVATAHDYKLICPSYTALREGKPCFRCARGVPLRVIDGQCLHGKLSWSGVAAVEASLTRARPSKLLPEVVLAPSQYILDRLEDSWLSRTGISKILLRNPCPPSSGSESRPPNGPGLYVGRLSPEKGLHLIVQAAARGKVPVEIVGDGPSRPALEELAVSLDAPVTFTGFLTGEALESRRRRASFFVMYPEWPENAPLALLEALSAGVPALVADIGGLAELPKLYGGGVVVPPGDVEELTLAMQELFLHGGVGPARADMHKDLGWSAHLERLETIYADVCNAY